MSHHKNGAYEIGAVDAWLIGNIRLPPLIEMIVSTNPLASSLIMHINYLLFKVLSNDWRCHINPFEGLHW